MGSLFSTPKVSRPEVPPPAPKEEDKAVQEAAAEAARRRKRSRGFRSTILGSEFIADDAPAAQGQTFGA